jgi:DNA polymerase III subunit delta'
MEIIGHHEQIAKLKRMIANNKIPHSLLLSGPSHIGKKTVALNWIKELYQKDTIENHPDFLMICPEKRQILLEEAEKIRQHLLLRPHSSGWKTVLVDEAHLMNHEAQSSLLKTLEEPRGQTIIILVSSQPFSFLPTITSRVQKISFTPVSFKEMVKVWPQADQSLLQRGAPGVLTDQKFLTKREKIKNNLDKILELDLKQRFQEVKKIAKEDDVGEILEEWTLLLREKMLQSKEKKSFRLAIESVQQTIYLISRRVNTKLALEALMIEL